MVVEISNFFVHHFSDFTCFLLTNNLHITNFALPRVMPLLFTSFPTESINPTLRHTSHLHPTPHGCPFYTISRPNTAISSLLSALMPLHHNRFTLVHLPSPIQCELCDILNKWNVQVMRGSGEDAWLMQPAKVGNLISLAVSFANSSIFDPWRSYLHQFEALVALANVRLGT